MRRSFAGICIVLSLIVPKLSFAQEAEAVVEETTEEVREAAPSEASSEQLDDLDLKELEFQIQQREQSLPMLWSAIYSLEGQERSEATSSKIEHLKRRSEQVKDEIRHLRTMRERDAPKISSPADARERAAQYLRQAEETLAKSGQHTAERMGIRALRGRLDSPSESFRAREPSRVPEELMERIRSAASPARLERRIAELAESVQRLQQHVERLQGQLDDRDEANEREE